MRMRPAVALRQSSADKCRNTVARIRAEKTAVQIRALTHEGRVLTRVPGLATLARTREDVHAPQFPNGFSFSSRACASFATLRSNSCSRVTFFSTKLKYLPLQKSCISMIELTSGRPSSSM